MKTTSKLNTYTCLNCNKVFKKYYKTRKYCSRVCMDIHKVGENSQSWRGGVSPENEKQRKNKRYREWRKAVFERDNYTCKECGQYSGVLNVHHIKDFSRNEELRMDINNGITLCVECHKKKHEKHHWSGGAK